MSFYDQIHREMGLEYQRKKPTLNADAAPITAALEKSKEDDTKDSELGNANPLLTLGIFVFLTVLWFYDDEILGKS